MIRNFSSKYFIILYFCIFYLFYSYMIFTIMKHKGLKMKLFNYHPKNILDLSRGIPSKQSIIRLRQGKIDALIGKSRVLELTGKWEECQNSRDRKD